MNVFTVWQDFPGQAEFMRAWDASWSARGWTPRILTARDRRVEKFLSTRRSKGTGWRSVSRDIANKIDGIGWVVSTCLINFDAPAKNFSLIKPVRYLSPDWEFAGLVLFDSVGQITSCGRALC